MATFRVLANFAYGSDPEAGLTIDGSGNLFGTTVGGGANNYGTIFEIPAANATGIVTLASFTATDSAPTATLILDSSGNLYGTTSGDAFYDMSGGTGNGTEFELTKNTGSITTITTRPTGSYPGGFYLDSTNKLLVALEPGTNDIAVTSLPSGSTKAQTSFSGGNQSDSFQVDPLVKIGANLYGTTNGSGNSTSPGEIFSYNYTATNPTITAVALFNTSTTGPGYASEAGVIADAAGNLYGTTTAGAANNAGAIFEYNSSTKALTALVSFTTTAGGSGYSSFGALLRDGAGDLFGTTQRGGANGFGTVFELKSGATTITTLYSFAGGYDGAEPYGALVTDSAGNLYGTSSGEGIAGTSMGAKGAVFEVSNTGFIPVCFAAGTLIRTARGDVAVEDLLVGDLAVTAAGEHRPVRWLGHRTIDCRRHPRPESVMPVRIAAHAFGENRPVRDLLVSPGHALCVDVVGEVLIMAASLINGTTITQEDVDSVTYWHVELEGGHDIILAENMPAESYIDMGNRAFFAENGVVALGANPDAVAPTHADFCRPFHMDGPLVDVVRAQLTARARTLGWQLEEQGLGDLHLVIDGVRVEPQLRGFVARFSVPAAARDVWLVSPTSFASTLSASLDMRPLGACLRSLDVDDGFGALQTIAVDDPRLCVGFHEIEGDGTTIWRWTAGRARLPGSLWAGLDGDLFLRLNLAGPMLPRWVAPAVVRSDKWLALAS